MGTLLLRRLAGSARHAGVRRLAGDVPRRDAAMLGLLEELGLEYEEQVTAATVHASFAVQETDAYLDAVLADQRAAARAAVGPFLCPRSIALVGASEKPASIGALLLANLLASGFTGPVYPVNPRHQVIQGVAAYPDLPSCPQPPDLALAAVPAPLVAGVVGQAGQLGVRAVCVISAGFAEAGGAGRGLQDDLRRRARAAGVRLIGPNLMGLLNGGPDPRFNATFSLAFPPPGRLAFVTQPEPAVAVKAGRTGAGRRAASSHTAALAAGETAVEALFHQAGVIRAGTLEEMFDVAAVISAQPAPAGRRVAVLQVAEIQLHLFTGLPVGHRHRHLLPGRGGVPAPGRGEPGQRPVRHHRPGPLQQLVHLHQRQAVLHPALDRILPPGQRLPRLAVPGRTGRAHRHDHLPEQLITQLRLIPATGQPRRLRRPDIPRGGLHVHTRPPGRRALARPGQPRPQDLSHLCHQNLPERHWPLPSLPVQNEPGDHSRVVHQLANQVVP